MCIRTVYVVGTVVATVALFGLLCHLLRRGCRLSGAAIFVGCVHLALVLVNACVIELDMLQTHPSEALMGWLWFDLADLPVSLIGIAASVVIKSFTLREIVFPIAFYGIAGTAQYMFFAELCSRMIGGIFKRQ